MNFKIPSLLLVYLWFNFISSTPIAVGLTCVYPGSQVVEMDLASGNMTTIMEFSGFYCADEFSDTDYNGAYLPSLKHFTFILKHPDPHRDGPVYILWTINIDTRTVVSSCGYIPARTPGAFSQLQYDYTTGNLYGFSEGVFLYPMFGQINSQTCQFKALLPNDLLHNRTETTTSRFYNQVTQTYGTILGGQYQFSPPYQLFQYNTNTQKTEIVGIDKWISNVGFDSSSGSLWFFLFLFLQLIGPCSQNLMLQQENYPTS